MMDQLIHKKAVDGIITFKQIMMINKIAIFYKYFFLVSKKEMD